MKSGAASPSRTTRDTSSRRAVGVVRVSRVGARSGEQFVSPSEQRTRIEQACGRDKLELVDTFEELDVSGGAPLAKRPGLRRAVEMVEGGEAAVVVVAYLDRLVRSLKVQLEVAERVERAGGTILALDVGEVATGKLTAQFLGAVAEYHRNVTAERTAEAKRRAIARGVPTFAKIPPGYRQRDDGTLEVDAKPAAVIRDAFDARANGATVMGTRDLLRAGGIERSFHGTQAILTSRIYLGELRFGELVNTASHPAIVDADTWEKVQRMRSPRGRRAKSERLLARLGILRCATCGARMVVGSTGQKLAAGGHRRHWFYRCPPIGDCPRRVTISAELAETAVVERVRELLAGVEGTATVGGATEQAERDYEQAEAELAAAVEAFTGLEDVAAARDKLQGLREARDRARDRLDDFQTAQSPAVTVSAEDWGDLTDDERRALIRAVIDRAEVAPGREANRITVVVS
jgi:DNA invertase Pin-like site-specific DNA recombinase